MPAAVASTAMAAATWAMSAPVARPVGAVTGAMSRRPVDGPIDVHVPIDMDIPVNVHVAIDADVAVIPAMPAGAAAPADPAPPREAAPVPAGPSPG
jgi:hypothetical protein